MSSKLAQYTGCVSLKGQVVMVTGATAGIGEACAWRFAAEGAKVPAFARTRLVAAAHQCASACAQQVAAAIACVRVSGRDSCSSNHAPPPLQVIIAGRRAERLATVKAEIEVSCYHPIVPPQYCPSAHPSTAPVPP